MAPEQPASDDTSMDQAKSALRARLSTLVRALPPPERERLSAKACDLLESRPEWTEATTILAFAPLPGELNLWPAVLNAIGRGQAVALPRFNARLAIYEPCLLLDPHRHLQVGRYGIREPLPECDIIPVNRLDFVLAPGVGFDPHGRRLGRGKGYYDRLLGHVRGLMCGAGFEEQLVERIPVAAHDVQLNRILTPARWIVCQRCAPDLE